VERSIKKLQKNDGKLLIPKAAFKKAVLSLDVLQGRPMAEDAWKALQTAAEAEVHHYMVGLTAIARAGSRVTPTDADVVAYRQMEEPRRQPGAARLCRTRTQTDGCRQRRQHVPCLLDSGIVAATKRTKREVAVKTEVDVKPAVKKVNVKKEKNQSTKGALTRVKLEKL